MILELLDHFLVVDFHSHGTTNFTFGFSHRKHFEHPIGIHQFCIRISFT